MLYTHTIRIDANKKVGKYRHFPLCLRTCIDVSCRPRAGEKEEPEEKTERDASLTAFISPLVIMHVGDA